MKTIPLSKGYVAVIDDEDYEDVRQFKWHAHLVKGRIYAVRNIYDKGIRSSEYMHRRIAHAEPGQQVDHWNHNGLDNQRKNLRACSPTQNSGNLRKRKLARSSKFKGVRRQLKSKKWTAQISINRKQRHIGCFSTEEEAARAYDAAAKNLFGEFALLNFPESDLK